MFFNKEKLKELGKQGISEATGYVKEESKNIIKDFIYTFLIKVFLIVIGIGIAIYFTFSGYFYVKEKISEAKEATVSYVQDKKEQISEVKNSAKVYIDNKQEELVSNIKNESSVTLNKVNNIKESIIENKEQPVEAKEESVIENKEQTMVEDNKFSKYLDNAKNKINDIKSSLHNSEK